MMPSDTEMSAMKNRLSASPWEKNPPDMATMPTMEAEFDTVSAAVAGLNRPATA